MSEDLSVAQAVRVLEHQAARHRACDAEGDGCCASGPAWHAAEAERLLAKADALKEAERQVLEVP